MRLRTRAKTCLLCGQRMHDSPYLAASKEIDHLVPVNRGGTNTLANLRVICRSCNGSRPKDGSDVRGQLALWCAVVS